MSSCTSCTQLAPIVKNEDSCVKVKYKLDHFRIACCDNLVESQTATVAPDCTYGYIDDIVSVDPIGIPEPFVAIDVVNVDDVDELDDFTFDRTTDTGEDTYSITLLVRLYTPEHECTFNSLKGQDICIAYKVTGKSGDFVWRRFKGTVTGITGGFIAGYSITIDNLNPDAADRPKFINVGTADTTETALNTLTQF